MIWLLLISAVSYADECTDLLSLSSQSDAVVAFKDKKVTITEDCIGAAMDQDWIDLAIQLVSAAMDSKVELTEVTKRKAQDKKRKIDQLLTAFEAKATVQTVSPAFVWAQSPDKMFMDIKFAHRFDSPGCLDIKEDTVEFEKNRLIFQGKCVQSGNKINYSLDLALFKEIDPEASTFQRTSVGRMQVTLVKANAPIAWDKIQKGKKLNNWGIWWEMKERYHKDMVKLLGDDAEDADLFDDDEKKGGSGLDDLINNPNVKIKNSYVDGKKIDNTDDEDL